jgi:hypothetical protein
MYHHWVLIKMGGGLEGEKCRPRRSTILTPAV